MSNPIKTMNLLCIVGYLVFMSLAIDSSMVDALVFYVTDEDEGPVIRTGSITSSPVGPRDKEPGKMVALQFKTETTDHSVVEKIAGAGEHAGSFFLAAAEGTEKVASQDSSIIESPASGASFVAPPPDPSAEDSEDESEGEEDAAANASDTPDEPGPTAGSQVASAAIPESSVLKMAPSSGLSKPAAEPELCVSSLPPGEGNLPAENGTRQLSILTIIKSLQERRWHYDPVIDRYVVDFDSDTKIVLTIRPVLQRMVENLFRLYSCKIGVAIVQDPITGAILAISTYDRGNLLSPDSSQFAQHNWAFDATFPVASIFKIVTASAGIDRKKVVPASRIQLGKKWFLELWKAFAKSHNGAFGVVGRALGCTVLQSYANAFGFNRPFFFDLPVTPSVARMPPSGIKLGNSAAGLDRELLASPIHVSSLISTILNNGRMMKPYLVDYVMYKGKVVFRRKPFQLSQPIPANVALQVYEMMKTTTTHGTAKKGFGCYREFPGLASLCGGKTGTLTGVSPKYWFTWFGGFTRTSGRDLAITVLLGQSGHTRTRASNLAGRIARDLLCMKNQPPSHMASR